MEFRWNEWNLDHIDRHDVSPEEAQWVVSHYPAMDAPDDKHRVRGQSETGRYLQVIFVLDPDDTIYVIHARDLTNKEKRISETATMRKNSSSALRKSRGLRKPYWEMTADELAEATKEFDREDLTEPAPLHGAKLERYLRAMRKRPRGRDGYRAITIAIETSLLAQADRSARRQRISRSELIGRALRTELANGRPRSKAQR